MQLKYLHKNYFLSVVFATLCLCNNYSISFAATDGTLGATSTGDTGITLGVSNLVRITGMNDLSFGTYSGVADFKKDDDVCIWTNQAGGNYKVTPKGDGASFAFTVTRGAGSPLAYTVKWNNTTGVSGNTSLTANTLSGAFSGASTTSSTCGGGVNANLQVIFDEATLLSSVPGTYTGVITLVISPSI